MNLQEENELLKKQLQEASIALEIVRMNGLKYGSFKIAAPVSPGVNIFLGCANTLHTDENRRKAVEAISDTPMGRDINWSEYLPEPDVPQLINVYKDGGTKCYCYLDHFYFLDRRIESTTQNQWYIDYPKLPIAKLVTDTELLSILNLALKNT